MLRAKGGALLSRDPAKIRKDSQRWLCWIWPNRIQSVQKCLEWFVSAIYSEVLGQRSNP